MTPRTTSAAPAPRASTTGLRCRLRIAALALLASTGWASAQTVEPAPSLELCARGIGLKADAPFTQMLRVTLTLRGQRLDAEERKVFAESLIRATVWPGKADRVHVEPWDAEDCASAGDAAVQLSAEVKPEDVAAARAALSRGDGALAAAAGLVQRTLLTVTGRSAEADAAQKRWLRMFYATNRKPSGELRTATAYGTDRSDELAFGMVDVSVRHAKRMDEVQSASVLKIEQATSLDDFGVAPQVRPLSLSAWREELRRRAARFEQPGVLLFIHGFNVSFVDAARRTAQLAYDLAFPGPTVFLSWPSDASVVQYLRDGRDARNSRLAASRLLAELATLSPSAPVYVIAHSMGNRVLTEGYQQLLQDQPGLARAFQDIVMAAPDVDQEDFRLNLAPRLLSSGPRFTLYASEHDLALGSSEFLQGGKRLGSGGPALFVDRRLDSVDASVVTGAFFSLNHSYFGDTTTVLSDLFYLIRQQRAPQDRPNLRRLSVGSGVAWRLGGTP
jgi:esterase/lipase superfamily enzyme